MSRVLRLLGKILKQARRPEGAFLSHDAPLRESIVFSPKICAPTTRVAADTQCSTSKAGQLRREITAHARSYAKRNADSSLWITSTLRRGACIPG
jgi:hypothetical protein